MDKVRQAYGHRCFLHFCVVGEEEIIPATAAAIQGHATAAFVAVPVGTVLSDCLKKIRAAAKVGYGAMIYGLDPEVGSWMTIEPEYMAYALQENEKLHFKLVRSPVEVDLSVDWAGAVLQPFPYSVVELEGLRRALAEPLPLALPIGAATYSSLAPALAPLFVPSTSFRAEAISCHITAFMISKVTPGMSENLLQSIWDHAFCTLWMDLLSLLDLTSIKFNRNIADHSGASANSVRPDLMLWVLNRLCVKFEEKRDNLAKALQDLVKKICALPPHYYGPVQWIIGVALARSDMAVWALRQGQQPDELSGFLSMTSQVDKASCLRFSINFLRVALTLTSIYGKLTYLPVPFTVLEPCTYGSREQITRRLKINYPIVVKEIRPWSEHVAEGFTTQAYVARAYAAAEESGSGCLVRGELEANRNDSYKVTLQPVGFEQIIANESELKVVIRHVVKGLQVLHAAGLVHRDVRWKNVLNTEHGTWMLIDLETVWECGYKPECSLRAWDSKTLVEGKYTEQSDLYLVGKLMSACPLLSHQGLAFQSRLFKHHFCNAEEVLADNYLHA